MRDCANPCPEEIRPVEVRLPKKWTKKFAFLSPHVGRPGKAFLDHAGVSKLYPWAKTNIKCSTRKKMACERPPLRHTTASNITSSAIADQDSLLLPTCTCSMHVEHSTEVHYCAVLCRCVGLHCAGFAHSTLSVARTCVLLRYSDSACT